MNARALTAADEYASMRRSPVCGRLCQVAGNVHGRRRLGVIATVAMLGGLLLGALDLLAQRTLPYPWANLANSSAVWACCAFGMGVWVDAGRWRPAVAGMVLLLVAVEAYYLTAALVQKDNLSNLWNSAAFLWLLFAVLAGAIFGGAGGWSRDRNRLLRVVGVALPSAVLLAEAGVLAYRSGSHDAAYRADSLETAAIAVVLALVLTLVMARGTRQRLESLAVSGALALIGFGGFVMTGFGG